MGIDDSLLKDRVIFVQGAPRSGTTLLANLLAAHPEVAGVEAESHLFSFGVDRLFDNFENRDPLHSGCLNLYLGSRREFVDLVRDLCDGVLLSMRANIGPPADCGWVVEKTPTKADEESLDLVRKRECYPDAWYLHIVRDGEAVTRSLMGAQWMGDRSRAECERFWHVAVESTRTALGDHPRYREVSYEELAANPVQVAAAIFRWLGIDAGAGPLETVRLLSRERFSDRGVVRVEGGRSRRAVAGRGARRVLGGTRKAAARVAARTRREGELAPGAATAYWFVTALRENDEEALRSLTTTSLALEYRSPAGDAILQGQGARAKLLEIASELFSRRPMNEWWASAGGGVSDWWTMVPGRPLWTLLFSALRGDASRIDAAFGLFMEDGRITRVHILSVGSLSGRPLRELGVIGDSDQTDTPVSR